MENVTVTNPEDLFFEWQQQMMDQEKEQETEIKDYGDRHKRVPIS